MKTPKKRRAIRTLALLAGALLVHAGAGAQELPPILDPGGPGAATDLAAEVDCTEDRLQGLVRLRWTPAREPGSEQRIAVTIFRDGLDTGNFDLTKPLPPDQTELVFERVQGQAVHRWVVLTLHEDGFVPSATARFEGPLCVNDEAPEPPVIGLVPADPDPAPETTPDKGRRERRRDQ